ncbi:FG-GAP repeat domain-containing protein [Streptomyces tanashiensis]|uniref:VCBS repeat-containing protein n=1 Tax=Streptomyces tanashiensis TaxID=67367 RepID=A0ABY6R0M4_9ACTN|nr:VCBS repeat-containing protein [Streptomyces tanashiensis]UZX22467.1 VCBS repeat-containing protein [Streptomyces tanashiensis]
MRTGLSRRVSVSVGIVLAAAAVTPFVAPAATAAPRAAAPAAGTATAPIPVPFLATGGRLKGAGATGFVSQDADGTARWTRYADGVSTVIEASSLEFVTGSASDEVAVLGSTWHQNGTSSVTFRDMASGAAPFTVPVDNWTEDVRGVVGSTAVVDKAEGDAPVRLAGRAGDRNVTGPDGGLYENFYPSDSLKGTMLGWGVPASGGSVVAAVDIATGRVLEEYPIKPGGGVIGSPSFTPTHVAWTEQRDGKLLLVSVVRGTKDITSTPLDHGAEDGVEGFLVGDWYVSRAPSASTVTPLTARSLTDGTTLPLLDHTTGITRAPDGTVLALGTSADRGSGVYRIAPGDGGKATARLIASDGRPGGDLRPLTYTGSSIPATIALDGVAKVPLRWTFSTTSADLSVTLTHKRTGERFTRTLRPLAGPGAHPDGSLGLDWAGEFREGDGEGLRAAFNGEYTWEVTARPWNGLASVTATGGFTVVRTTKAHDYTDNGSPDLFARDKAGELHRIDTRWDDATGQLVPAYDWDFSSTADRGYGAYDRLESVGDIAGSETADTVGRDAWGDLWLHQGTRSNGGSSFVPRVRIGTGWWRYYEIAGGSDLTGDGRADTVAVEDGGDLYLYAGTGDASAPFAREKKIGFGWNIYNQVTAVGNIAGAPAGDLVARDKAGVLWLYLGKGDGTYAPRTRIGGGWGVYSDLVGIGDGNKDGRPDLFARGPQNTSYFYAGTGDWRAPFKPRASTRVGVYREGAYGTPYNKFA